MTPNHVPLISAFKMTFRMTFRMTFKTWDFRGIFRHNQSQLTILGSVKSVNTHQTLKILHEALLLAQH